MKSLNYGELPSFEEYAAAFAENVPSGVYEIRNCRELDAVYSGGDVDLDFEGLWELLSECSEGHPDNHEMADLGSCILSTLGFEWI